MHQNASVCLNVEYAEWQCQLSQSAKVVSMFILCHHTSVCLWHHKKKKTYILNGLTEFHLGMLQSLKALPQENKKVSVLFGFTSRAPPTPPSRWTDSSSINSDNGDLFTAETIYLCSDNPFIGIKICVIREVWRRRPALSPLLAWPLKLISWPARE